MKKLVPILLAMVMIFAMNATIFASASTVTFGGDQSKLYDGYKLLDLTVSLKGDCTCAEGATHVDACYNYAYTVNAKYLAVLQAVTGKTTEEEIIAYLGALTSDVNGESGTLREVADDIYEAIVAASIAADETDLNGTATIDNGYWMFADVTEVDGKNEATSLVMVDTKGENDITINPKTGLPTLEKKVKDINNSEDADITDNDWQDSADHDISDVVPFQLTATLPENVSKYDSYKIAFHDIMSAGLTFNANSVKVMIGDTDVTANFTTTTENIGGETFVISCDNVLAIDGVDKDTVFTVYYEATLNEGAVIGAAGNPNEAYLEFSNNPYTDGTGKTENDKVIVFTYQVIINKTDADGTALKGAGFELYKKNAEGEYVIIGTELKDDDMTTFTWTGLDDGDYKLVESTVPAGYNKMDDIEFSITAEHDEENADPALTSLDGGNLATGLVDTGAITKDIANFSGTVLPETGAKGTFMLICGGALIAMIAVVFMITRKKMSVYEA